MLPFVYCHFLVQARAVFVGQKPLPLLEREALDAKNVLTGMLLFAHLSGFCGSDRLFSMSPPTGMGKMLENGVLRFLDSKSTVEDGYHTHLPEDTTCL